MFNKKKILITGGTGSFGKSFVAHILKNYKPKKLVIFSRDELKQHEMSQDYPNTKKQNRCLRFLLGDVRDRDRLMIAFKEMDFIIHAAAQKHVHYAEYNPQECIKTNIDGAKNVIFAAISNKVKKVIALSTDKAVNPINIYGASKLVSDKLFIAANNLSDKNGPIFSVVRYGNVLSSRGSVIPFFKKLIEEGKNKLPVTDLNMSRFIISLKDGINFVIFTLKNMKGGEIFVPKIPSLKIVDLVKAMGKNIKIKIIGLKPGEKISEVLCPMDESHLTVEFKKFYIILPTIDVKVKRHVYLRINNEKGKFVEQGFEYNSDKQNKLNVSQIRKILQ